MTETRLSPDELKTLFLFESLGPEQLTWLSERGTAETRTTSQPIYREGEEATCFFVLLDGTISMTRSMETTQVETVRSNQRGIYAGATQSFVGTRPSTAIPTP